MAKGHDRNEVKSDAVERVRKERIDVDWLAILGVVVPC